MVGKISRVMLVAGILVLSVGLWPAHAELSNVAVTNPVNDAVIQGNYVTGGGFEVNIRGTANTSCSQGFNAISFSIAGPSPSGPYSMSPSGTSFSGGPTDVWNTRPLRNGVYTVSINVTDKQGIWANCNGQQKSASNTVKVANASTAPVWAAKPEASAAGAPSVNFSWKKNSEPDIVEYQIVRSHNGETAVAPVPASSPGSAGCSLSNGVYTCTDTAFPAQGYGGSYDYQIVAARSRPAYGANESPQYKCLSATSTPCVRSAGSSIGSATFTEPTSTPTPQPSPSHAPPPTPDGNSSPTTSGQNGPAGAPPAGSTQVLSFGSTRSGDFYTGTYETQLPYEPKTLLVPETSRTTRTTQKQNRALDAETLSETAPDYRTVMLPIAGGLLAFLSAAHVRRLLTNS